MADLTEAQVRALAQALELPLTGDDAVEVTHRLNAFIDALAPLANLDTQGVDAVPAPVDPDRACRPRNEWRAC
jgi:Asp-tRNA(Asn)/Glu-tRNA(Gln) amidotransferase C subunit